MINVVVTYNKQYIGKVENFEIDNSKINLYDAFEVIEIPIKTSNELSYLIALKPIVQLGHEPVDISISISNIIFSKLVDSNQYLYRLYYEMVAKRSGIVTSDNKFNSMPSM